MSVIKVYDGIYRTLANDEILLNLLGVDTSLEPDELSLQKALKIQKRSRPQDLDENIPLISFYRTPGGWERNNDCVYVAPFIFDVYTSDDVELAHKLTERLIALFHKEIPKFQGIETYEAKWEDSFETIINDIPNIYCFTSILVFSVTFSD